MEKSWVSTILGNSTEIKDPILATFVALEPRGELIEREVYEFFEMLGDIGGFNDGLQLVLGYIMLLYNSRWYKIKLNLSVFRTVRLIDGESSKKET